MNRQCQCVYPFLIVSLSVVYASVCVCTVCVCACVCVCVRESCFCCTRVTAHGPPPTHIHTTFEVISLQSFVSLTTSAGSPQVRFMVLAPDQKPWMGLRVVSHSNSSNLLNYTVTPTTSMLKRRRFFVANTLCLACPTGTWWSSLFSIHHIWKTVCAVMIHDTQNNHRIQEDNWELDQFYFILSHFISSISFSWRVGLSCGALLH